jgi:hypothetical protein
LLCSVQTGVLSIEQPTDRLSVSFVRFLV